MPEIAPTTVKIKIPYGIDPDSDGRESFFWPASKHKRKEAQTVRRNSPADFESTYQQNPGFREGAIFTENDFAYYEPPQGLMLGIQAPDVKRFCVQGHSIVQAWDTAFSTTSSAAYTAGITGLLIPCQQFHCNEDPAVMGECEPHFDVAILDVFREKIAAGDLGGKGLVTASRREFLKWQAELMLIENRASGITLIQSLPSLNIPVLGINPKEGKRARAINTVSGAGSAQGWFQLHRVLFPRWAAWLEVLKTELKDFTGDESAVTDQVDAIVHLICYAIEQGSKAIILPKDWTPDRIAAEMSPAFDQYRELNDDRISFMTAIGDLEANAIDPFEATCARCVSFVKETGFCRRHKRNMVAFDVCQLFESREDAARAATEIQ